MRSPRKAAVAALAIPALLAAALPGILAACSSAGGGGDLRAAAPPDAEAAAAPAPAEPRAPEPPRPAPAPPRKAAIGNLLTVTDGLYSGEGPATDAQFDAIAALGVRTIISVDGAKPDLARAKARGMRYVHLPTTYSGIPRERQLQLAKALRDLPGPIYLHCHHGKHRGPAAAAGAAVILDLITQEEAQAFLRRAGTSPSYPGLYASVRSAWPVSAGVLDAARADFPEIAPIPGFVEAMVETELCMSHLKAIEAAGWTTPADHPDLVPAAEAGRLADLLRNSRHDPYVKEKDSTEFLYFLLANADRAQDLENAIVAGEPAARLSERFKMVGSSCKDCHVRFRDGK